MLQLFKVRGGGIVAQTRVTLHPNPDGTVLYARADGNWRVISVYVKDEPVSLDPMHPLSGKQTIEKFYQRFEDHNPGEAGKGLNFFFSDELSFGVKGWLWNRYFARVPQTQGLRRRAGTGIAVRRNRPRAVKVRLDYSDVMVALEEENYFKPIYDWHGMHGSHRAMFWRRGALSTKRKQRYSTNISIAQPCRF